MRLSAKVVVDGEETLVVTRPIDIIKWETGTKRKITDGLGYGDMLQIIHSAVKREGGTDLSFNDWAATLEDFSPEAGSADPTQTEASTDI